MSQKQSDHYLHRNNRKGLKNHSFSVLSSEQPQEQTHCEFDTWIASVPKPDGGDITVNCWSLSCKGSFEFETGGCSSNKEPPEFLDKLLAPQ